MQIKPLRPSLVVYLRKHSLKKKFEKQCKLLKENHRHPSLHTELLLPKELGLYSFRIDQKYRAIFIVMGGAIEIIDINNHYQR